MKDNKGIFIGIAVVVVLAIAGGVALMSNSDSKDSNSGYSSDKMNMDTSKKTDSTKSADSAKAADTSKAVEATNVTIQNFAFDAPIIKVKVGTTVTWTNKDGVKHNVNPDSPSADFPVGKLIGNGETYSFTFTKVGTYGYHCMPHPYMKGTVVVTR